MAMSSGRTITDHLSLLIGQWFYSGRSKIAPGTVGSFFALPLFLLIRDLDPFTYWLITFALTLLGVAVSQRCATLLQNKDPSSVVIDEVAGVMIALGFVTQGPLWLLALCWILFRFFDINKPSLIDRAQYWSPVGWGIMADDVLAGLCAGVIGFGILSITT